MTQTTSAEAYRWIQDSPYLQSLQRQILSVMATKFLPMTANEITEAMNPAPRINTANTRFSELRRMGTIREAGKRPCRVTGRNCMTWELTGAAPEPLPKRQKVACVCPTCGSKVPETAINASGREEKVLGYPATLGGTDLPA